MYDPDHYTDGLDRQKNPIEQLGLRPVIIGLLLFWGAVAWWFETEWHDESELRGWMPYPQSQNTEESEEHF